MLLTELKTSDKVRIAKINRALKESYGFSLNSNVSTDKLQNLHTKVSNDLNNLKLNQYTARDSEYVQKLLMQEGLEILLKETILSGPGSRAFERVVNWLKEYVRKSCEVGDEYEEAIYEAMKQYRSSKYRFDDAVVEYELRKGTSDCEFQEVDEVYTAMNEEFKEKDRIKMPNKYGYAPKAGSYKRRMHKAQPAENHEKTRKRYKKSMEEDASESIELEVWRVGVPANIYKGKYYEEGFVPVDVSTDVANTAEEAVRYVLDNQEEALERITRKRSAYGGRPYVAKPVEKNVKFDEKRMSRMVKKMQISLSKRRVEDNILGHTQEVDETNLDRYAEHDWVQGIKRDQAKASGDLDTELSLAEPDDDNEAEDYFSYQRKKTKMKEGYVKKLRKLLEAEVEQAESLIAAKSFSQELQDMIEKLGRLVNEDLPAVSEQMRDSHGADVATNFEDQVSSTLNGIMDSLRDSKQDLDNSVSTIADGGMPSVSNDMDDFEADGELDDLDVDADVDLDIDDELEVGDELGGLDAAAGPEDEELGRAKKESVQAMRKKIVEMQEKIARAKKRKK